MALFLIIDTIRDYAGDLFVLTIDTWKHIIDERARKLTLEDIKSILKDPCEVWEDLRYKENSKCDCRLYYQRRNAPLNKPVYLMVSVKMCSDNNYITSAYKIRKIKGQRLLYKKLETR